MPVIFGRCGRPLRRIDAAASKSGKKSNYRQVWFASQFPRDFKSQITINRFGGARNPVQPELILDLHQPRLERFEHPGKTGVWLTGARRRFRCVKQSIWR